MSRVDGRGNQPRAMIHRRILDVAGSRPEATLEEVAESVGGATPDLVERVLEEYGDPADGEEYGDQDDQTTSGETEEPAMKENGHSAGEPADAEQTEDQQLSTKQRETLRLVHEDPSRSQSDVAAQLGVSRATVSRRLNDIPGFDWQHRASFTAELFEDDPGTAEGTPNADGVEPDGPRADRLGAIEERLSSLESTLDDGSTGLPPALAHKVVHAAMESDRVSENEELRLLEALLE